jgi:hypothetical protein
LFELRRFSVKDISSPVVEMNPHTQQHSDESQLDRLILAESNIGHRTPSTIQPKPQTKPGPLDDWQER